MKQLSLILLFSMIGRIATAQDYEFRVLANRGNNLLVRANTGQSNQLKSGDGLFLDDQLTTNEDSYIGLVHKNGQTYELRQAGTFSLNDVYEQAIDQERLGTKYLSFLWDKAYQYLLEAKEGNPISPFDLQPTGVNSGKLQVVGADPQKLNPILGSTAEIKWIGGPPGTTSYTVSIMNLYDQEIISAKVLEPTFTLDLTDERLQQDEMVTNTRILSFIVVSDDNKDFRSWRYGLSPLRGPNAESVSEELRFFRDTLTPISVLDRLVFAHFFEEKGLLFDALAVYESILKDAPEVGDYRLLYNAFVKRSLHKMNGRGL